MQSHINAMICNTCPCSKYVPGNTCCWFKVALHNADSKKNVAVVPTKGPMGADTPTPNYSPVIAPAQD
jgi:hypothetical protein